MSTKLIEAIAEMRETEALALVRESLEAGADPLVLLENCRTAMDIVGQRFAEGVYFIPELIMAGEMLAQISDMTKSLISPQAARSENRLGKVVIGTVQGDIHDIGKNLVVFMLDLNGFEVIDIGVDQPPSAFVDAVKTHKPAVVGLCGLLTLAYEPMKKTVTALGDAGMREKVKIMIGGGAVDEKIREFADADAYGKDAVAAVNLARKWVGEKS